MITNDQVIASWAIKTDLKLENIALRRELEMAQREVAELRERVAELETPTEDESEVEDE